MESRLDKSGIQRASLELETATAVASIEWAWAQFGDRCCLLSSMQDSVLIDLAMRVDARLPIIFLDTGYHFAETHQTRRAVEARYGVQVQVIGPLGGQRSEVEPGECCVNKPALLKLALAERDCWISGLSRYQTANRSKADIVERDARGKVKINPLIQWNRTDRDRYIAARQVITNPLLAAGYTSIGCAPCTTLPGGDERSGRWAGTQQTECGLHL